MSEPIRHRADFLAPPDDVDQVHELLELVWAEVPDVSPMDRMTFETAIIELAANVIEHASKASAISCSLTIDTYPDRIEAHLVDDADDAGVDLSVGAMPGELAESGRGIALIKVLVSEFGHRHDGEFNRWRLVRMRE